MINKYKYIGTSGGIPDAPSDGDTYGRKDGQWEQIIGGQDNNEVWLPSVDVSGNISWNKSDTDIQPTTQNIKGPKGEDGASNSDEITVTTSPLNYTPDSNSLSSHLNAIDMLLFKQGYSEYTMNTTAGISMDFVATDVSNDLVPQVFVNGILDGASTRNITITKDKITFTPTTTNTGALIQILYSTKISPLEKDPQILSVDFEIDAPNTTVLSALYLNASKPNVPIIVNRGDGQVETVIIPETLSIQPSHTYENAGTYTVTIEEEYGFMTGCRFNAQSVKVVKKLNKYKGNGITFTTSMFTGQVKFDSFADGFKFETPNLTTANAMYTSCTALTSVPAGSLDLCTKLTNVTGHFDKSGITSIPTDYLKNCTEITTASTFCRQCLGLTSVPNVFSGLSKLTIVGSAFQGCLNITSLHPDLYKGCTSLTTLTSAHESNTKLVAIPTGLFNDLTSAITFDSIFYNCAELTTVPLNLFVNCTNAKTMIAVFRSCPKVTSLPTLDTNTEINTMQLFASGCVLAQNLPSINAFADKLTNLNNAFLSCKSHNTNLQDFCSNPLPLLANTVKCFDGNYTATTTGLRGSALQFIALCTGLPSTGNASTSTTFRACTLLSDLASVPTGWK